jgi:hypothetical protein
VPSDPPRRLPTAHASAPLVGLALLLCASLVLAACGGSSAGSNSATSASTSATSAGKSATAAGKGAGSATSAALRSCLAKQGITLPSASAGASPQSSAPPTGSSAQRPGGGFKLPKGESTTQLQAALKKCGGGSFPAGAGARFGGASSSKTLAKFSVCMREHGVKLPTANTSGKGPVFNTKGLNTSSATFKAAESKCSSDLGAAGAGGGAPAGGGTPPGGGGAPGGGAPPAGEAG